MLTDGCGYKRGRDMAEDKENKILHPLGGASEFRPPPEREDTPPMPSGEEVIDDSAPPEVTKIQDVVETEEEVKIPVENAEESLIGIFMQDEDAAQFIAQSGLREEHFLKRKCRLLYPVVLNVRLTQGTCNFDFVVDACEKKILNNGQTLLDFIGGVPALTQIIASPISTDIKTTEGYVNIVWEKWRLSKIKEEARKLVSLPGFNDLKIVDAVSQLQAIVADTSLNKHGLVSIGSLLPEAYVRYEDRLAHPEKYVGIKTGFYWLDKYRAIAKKRTTIVAARTGIGKSIFVGNMITVMLQNGLRILLYTPELDKEEYIDRIVCSNTGISIDDWKKAVIREVDVEKIHAFQVSVLNSYPDGLYIEDRGSQSANYILGSIRRHMLSQPVDVVVIDYLQKLRFYGDNIRREIDDAMDKLSSFAKDNNIAMILVSQLRRSDKAGAEPTKEDLKESGNLENFADTVILLHRKSTINITERREAWYRIDKHRSGPTTEAIKLNFHEDILKFTEAEPPPSDDVNDFESFITGDEVTEQSVMQKVKEFDENYGKA